MSATGDGISFHHEDEWERSVLPPTGSAGVSNQSPEVHRASSQPVLREKVSGEDPPSSGEHRIPSPNSGPTSGFSGLAMLHLDR